MRFINCDSSCMMDIQCGFFNGYRCFFSWRQLIVALKIFIFFFLHLIVERLDKYRYYNILYKVSRQSSIYRHSDSLGFKLYTIRIQNIPSDK